MAGRDYGREEVIAAKRVLAELAHLLNDFSEGLVIIGGFAPMLLAEQSLSPHVGTKDVDIVLNGAALDEASYHSMFDILMQNRYQQIPAQPFRWERRVTIQERQVAVFVDFLTPGESNLGMKVIQELKALNLKCGEVALLGSKNIRFSAQEPSGAQTEVSVQVISFPMFLVLKGNAIQSRANEEGRKDAYDIFYCFDYYRNHVSGGLESLAAEFRPHLSHEGVIVGLRNLREAFGSMDHIGPRWAADGQIGLRDDSNAEEWDQVQRDAYEMAERLFELLGVPRFD